MTAFLRLKAQHPKPRVTSSPGYNRGFCRFGGTYLCHFLFDVPWRFFPLWYLGRGEVIPSISSSCLSLYNCILLLDIGGELILIGTGWVREVEG